MKKLIIFLILLQIGFCNAQQKIEVYFEFDKDDLTEIASQKLDDFISNNPDAEVLKIYGYCDWKGENKYNDTLSIRRVATVERYLRDKIEIRPNYVAKGFGEDFEQYKKQSLNRKVAVIYQQKMLEKLDIKKPTLSEKVAKSKTGDVIKLENINFYNMSGRILPRSLPTLTDLLCAMEENPKLKIEIQGHICCQTQDQNDLTYISTLRARTIYNYLISHKINRNRLSFKGYGVTRPLHPIPEKTDLEQEENRRVEILILENGE